MKRTSTRVKGIKSRFACVCRPDFRGRTMIAFGVFFLLGIKCEAGQFREFRDVRIKMGSRFELTVVLDDADQAKKAIDDAYQEIDRLEALISSWKEGSQTSTINRRAGIEAVVVDEELFELTRRALRVSEWTDGAFDISFAGMQGLWQFKGENQAPPEAGAIARLLPLINYKNVELDPILKTVFLKNQGMRIGFGAIGKGLAANGAAKVLKKHGVKNGLVDAGGDLLPFGLDVTGQPWRIGIIHPRAPGKLMMELRMTDCAVVTSGDYERYFIYEGKRYAHIINPKTGWPADQLRSATIICPDAELADALATAVFVMGPEKGMECVNSLKHIECILIDTDNRVTVSKGIDRKIIEEFTP